MQNQTEIVGKDLMAEGNQKKSKMVKILIYVMAMITTLVVIYWVYNYSIYRKAVQESIIAYKQSRTDPSWQIDSYEFKTFGVKYQMTQQEVDKLIVGASKVFRHMRLQSEPYPEGHFANIYDFEHGPEYSKPLSGSKEILFYESVIVNFDNKGRAYSMERHVSRNLRGLIPWEYINLKSRTINTK